MRKVRIAAVAAVLGTIGLAGCGGGGAASTGAPSPSAQKLTLKEACPHLEQVTPTSAFPSHDRLSKYVATLFAMQQRGDLETRQAIAILQKPANEMMTAVQGAQSADAFADWTRALQEMKDRCAAVGSGAFQ